MTLASDLPPVRLRKRLTTRIEPPQWPAGINLRAFQVTDAKAVHEVLAAGYADGGGDVAAFEAWWARLSKDSEYDPALVFLAVDAGGRIAGVAQCWTGGFVKDLVVDPAWRGQGIGRALLAEVFQAFAARGLKKVELKARGDNGRAIQLYRRMGMAVVA